jgi:hypothetical protein
MDELISYLVDYTTKHGIAVVLFGSIAYYFYSEHQKLVKKYDALLQKFDDFVAKEHASMIQNTKELTRVVETNNFVLQRVERKLDELSEKE